MSMPHPARSLALSLQALNGARLRLGAIPLARFPALRLRHIRTQRRDNRRSEIIQKLSDGIARLTTSETWQHWLEVQGRFHRYSFNNTLLIQLQRPEATQVADFHAWRKLGRNVRKGEKGIWILAPMTYKVTDSDDQENGTEARVLRGFKPVPGCA
jgi:N-terminal domain of anti-restriction factor ArdC